MKHCVHYTVMTEGKKKNTNTHIHTHTHTHTHPDSNKNTMHSKPNTHTQTNYNKTSKINKNTSKHIIKQKPTDMTSTQPSAPDARHSSNTARPALVCRCVEAARASVPN